MVSYLGFRVAKMVGYPGFEPVEEWVTRGWPNPNANQIPG